MPAKSVKQRRFMGMVRAAQQGEAPASPQVAKAAHEMQPQDVMDFAATKQKGLPMKKRLRPMGHKKSMRRPMGVKVG